VLLVGAVGSDFPRDEIERLRRRGVDLRGLQEVPGASFRWAGRYHEDLNIRETLRLDLNAFAQFRPLLPEDYRTAEFVFLGNIQPELQLSILDQTRSRRFVACDTLPYWITHALPALRALLRRVDLLMVNEEEARLLGEEQNLVRAARRMLQLGPRHVLVKRGEYGVLAFSSTEPTFAVPAYPLATVVDPTGAGDSFAGGLMGELARSGDVSGRSLRRAIIQGSVVASFVVEDFGARRLMAITDSDLKMRCDEFSQLTRLQ
jgi:sugar/nucleoside kinase (ribokinase family)